MAIIIIKISTNKNLLLAGKIGSCNLDQLIFIAIQAQQVLNQVLNFYEGDNKLLITRKKKENLLDLVWLEQVLVFLGIKVTNFCQEILIVDFLSFYNDEVSHQHFKFLLYSLADFYSKMYNKSIFIKKILLYKNMQIHVYK